MKQDLKSFLMMVLVMSIAVAQMTDDYPLLMLMLMLKEEEQMLNLKMMMLLQERLWKVKVEVRLKVWWCHLTSE